jgi:hypothetical protein
MPLGQYPLAGQHDSAITGAISPAKKFTVVNQPRPIFQSSRLSAFM